eukprot:CAMPEP_0117814106 /NCGR_PEP_ID=MMETSP0948-20121206/23932_1 /TAXON_ID=44440 /ORGANISM="Chattonella subsalsa, Strain CCMP2191" /LENGTH=346 /DNA_ID=CAMNT_0005651641 /DNA_START=90 /DNA_END=1129 /DNA_ORIENTATION=+
MGAILKGEDDSTGTDNTTDTASDNSDTDSDTDYDSDEEDDDEDDTKDFLMKDSDAKDFQGRVARQGGIGGAQMKESVRNLRIREDTAKYLRNLDPNSAFYDPKTRSMRANPMPSANPDEVLYAGDNWVRTTGDAVDMAKAQVYAWESEKRRPGYPFAGEPQMVYSRDGRVISGAPKAVVRTKYQEDVLENNHTAIWGSYFDRRCLKWGYGCCHSLQRNSYCTGEKGKKANEDANSSLAIDKAQQRKMLQPKPVAERQVQVPLDKSKLYGEYSAVDLDKEKLKKAIAEQERFQKQKVEMDDRKRKYNSMNKEEEITPEVMEAYRLKKKRSEDPMSKLLSSDVLLEDK